MVYTVDLKRLYTSVSFQHQAEDFWAVYKTSSCAVEQRRAQLLALLAEGRSEVETLELTHYSVSGARKIIDRYRRLGMAGLKDGRHDNKGAPPVLTPEEQRQFTAAVQHDFDHGIVWDGKKAQLWVKEVLGKDIHLGRGYERLHAAGFGPQKPRRQQAKGDSTVKEVFKTKS